MIGYEYLLEHYANVNKALGETLRQDYGPEQSSDYYTECEKRLFHIKNAIDAIDSSNQQLVSEYIRQLDYLASWICQIERSQLGAFSWPFADNLRRMAVSILTERDLIGEPSKPITHIVADGSGYRINYEDTVPLTSCDRKFVVISFPRSLKHHVLLHTIFGHELGHAALFGTISSGVLQPVVLNTLSSVYPLNSPSSLTAWMHDPSSPSEIKRQLTEYVNARGVRFEFTLMNYQSWLVEIFCDIFGLLTFGPSFLAAHRSILYSMGRSAYECNLSQSTHPPYAVRQSVMRHALDILSWNNPIIDPSSQKYQTAEASLIAFINGEAHIGWADIVPRSVIEQAITEIGQFLAGTNAKIYTTPSSECIVKLIDRLSNRLPPIYEDIKPSGEVEFVQTPIGHCMYAGWIYWLSRTSLVAEPLDFISTNRLCDLALLQQEAINRQFYPERAA